MSKNTVLDYQAVPSKDKEINNKDVPASYGYGIRHVQAFLIFASLSIGFIARAHLGISIVAMSHIPDILNEVNIIMPKNVTDDFSSISNTSTYKDFEYESVIIVNEDIFFNNVTENRKNSTIEKDNDQTIFTVYRTYEWSKSVQEMVLGSFFLGYFLMTFPIGLVCQRWGGKIPIQIALGVNGLVSILTPWMAAWGGWKAVCACRIMQGLSQSGFYPAVQTLIARWSPASERGRLSSYIYTGTTFGNVLAFQVGGILAASPWGWPSIFWITGALCLAMFVIFTIFGAATPLDTKYVSVKERNYILGKFDSGLRKKNQPVPWKAILTSKPVWATVATHLGSGVSFVFFFTQVPSYIHYILGINVKESGLLSSLPYIASFFMSIFYGLLSDFCTNRGYISVKNARRVFNCIAQFGVALCFICVSFTRNVELSVTCLVLCLSLHTAVHTGWMVNHIDLASNYTASLMAIGNSILNMGNVIMPFIVSFIVTDVTNQIHWRIMFVSVAALALATNAIFVIFMSSESQPWNDYGYEEAGTEGKLENGKERKQ